MAATQVYVAHCTCTAKVTTRWTLRYTKQAAAGSSMPQDGGAPTYCCSAAWSALHCWASGPQCRTGPHWVALARGAPGSLGAGAGSKQPLLAKLKMRTLPLQWQCRSSFIMVMFLSHVHQPASDVHLKRSYTVSHMLLWHHPKVTVHCTVTVVALRAQQLGHNELKFALSPRIAA